MSRGCGGGFPPVSVVFGISLGGTALPVLCHLVPLFWRPCSPGSSGGEGSEAAGEMWSHMERGVYGCGPAFFFWGGGSALGQVVQGGGGGTVLGKGKVGCGA